jgi:molybdenum cofactor cytidylyltransferase
MAIAGVVLAAGRSARMGTPKALLDFRGEPFVVRILEALEALELKLRLVVLGADAPRILPVLAPRECVILENANVEGGPITSLRCALTALRPVRPAAMLAWPVDLPHVRVSTAERLLQDYRRSGAPATLPAFGERRGHPVLWDSSLFPELESSEEATRHGAWAVLRRHEDRLRVIPVDDPAVIDDLNTPADYERLVRELNRDIY